MRAVKLGLSAVPKTNLNAANIGRSKSPDFRSLAKPA